MEDSLYTPSLVWVCLACGQLAPHHAEPNDLIDSAAAMDLSVSPLPPFTPHRPSPPLSLSADIHADAYRAAGGVWQSPQQQQQQQQWGRAVDGEPSGRYESASRGNSCSNSGDDTCSAGSHHRRVLHSPRSHSHEAADSCLNNESDSYLSMAAASHHRHHHHRRRHQQQQQQLDGVQAALSGQLQRVATHDDALPRQRTSSSYASDNNNNNGSRRLFQHHSSHGSVAAPDPMQSLAALLMEEHLVGTREMRFCEGCREVRCAEIRKAGEFESHGPHFVTPSATAAAATLQAGSDQQRSQRSVPAERVRDAAPAVSSFLCAYDSPMSATETVAASDIGRPPFTTRPRSASFDAAPAPSGSSRQRDVPSVHLVVALSIARMVVKLKNAAVSVVTNFHPLSPSLPTARRSDRGDNNADDAMHGDTVDTDRTRPQDQQRNENERRRTNAHAATQPHDTTATPSLHSYGRATTAAAAAAKTQPGRVISSLNSSLDEATALGGEESNGISYNSFATAPSQHHPQHSWHVEDCASAVEEEEEEGNDDHPLASGERGEMREASPIGMPAHAQLLFPDGGVNSSDGDSGSGSGPVLHAADALTTASPPASTPTCATAGTAAMLRVSKNKWNSINVTEALWRLVLPSFSAPFLTSAAPSAQEGSNYSTPHRGAPAAAVSGVSEGSSRPYRGFKGEVEVAVGKLDAMQLEVAKLRLEQVLAEVVAEQARRARGSDEGY